MVFHTTHDGGLMYDLSLMHEPERLMHRLPPISALRALDAAARHLSFTKAAAEMHVTQSAVSHQIKYLEELWSQQLFVRLTRRLELTPAGQALTPVLREFLMRLEDTLNMLKEAKTGQIGLRVWVFPSVALKWLVPRLPRFREAYPNIDVWIATRASKDVGFHTGQLDAAFHLGECEYPNFTSWQLMQEYVYPVARPQFFKTYQVPETPADLCRYPLLLRMGDAGAAQWEFWFGRAGVPEKVYAPALRAGTRFSDSAMVLQAALEGQGVALARSATVWDDLQARRLTRLFDITCPFHRAMHLICPSDRTEYPAVVAFRDWLLAESAKCQAKFDAVEKRNAAKAQSSTRIAPVRRRHTQKLRQSPPDSQDCKADLKKRSGAAGVLAAGPCLDEPPQNR